MTPDEWLDRQEESDRQSHLMELVDKARHLGVDVPQLISATLDGYKAMEKLKLKRVLVQSDIVDEIGMMTVALQNAIKAKEGQ